MSHDALIDSTTMAETLAITRERLYDLLHDGTIEAGVYRVGTSWRFNRSAVLRSLAVFDVDQELDEALNDPEPETAAIADEPLEPEPSRPLEQLAEDLRPSRRAPVTRPGLAPAVREALAELDARPSRAPSSRPVY